VRSSVHQNTTSKQSNGTTSAVWNNQEVDSEQEHKETPHLGKPFSKPGATGSAGDKPTPPTPISFDFSKIPIFPPQQARIQPKLKINAPGDRFEQEADRVAEQVMRMPEPLVQRKPQWAPPTQSNPFAIQRMCDACAKDEKETLQAKSAGNTGGMVAPGIAQQIQNSRGGGKPMDPGTRTFMESRFGTDFGKVRIHADKNAALFNQRLQARAFTFGRDVYFNQGHYSPCSVEGRRLLAHELVHVVQQGAESNLSTIQRKLNSETPQDELYGPPLPDRLSISSATNNEGKQPELGEFIGKDINKAGKISADATNFKDAVAIGMNIRSKPLPEKNLVIGKIKYGKSVFIKASDNTGKWYYVVSFDGTAGWISQAFVVTDMPDVNAELHHITESNLTTILKNHYIDTGKWQLSTGNDYTTLVTAVAAANQVRKGIKFDPKKYKDYKEKMDDIDWQWSLGGMARELKDKTKANFDPVMENFAIYQATKILSGHNIWLPSPAYIKVLQDTGIVASRPDWMNTAISAGQGIAGFTAGVYEGFFGAIVDALEGLWEIGKGIISTIGDVFTGEIFEKIEDLYNEFKNLTWDKVKQIVESLLSAIVEGVNDFKKNWSHPDMYKKWNFRGRIVGNVLLEVVLAILTAGAGNALKWAGRLGKIAPKLAKIITKAIDKAEDVLPPKFKKKGRGHEDKHDKSLDEDKDSKAGQKQQALVLAKMITEAEDAKDTPVPELMAKLLVVKKKFSVVKRFGFDEKATAPGHYKIIMYASEHTVNEDYTPGHSYPTSEKDTYEGRKEHRSQVANAKWHDHNHKHKKAKSTDEAKTMSMNGGDAQYLPDVNNKALEKLATQKGKVFTAPGNKNVTYFFYKSDKIIGYDQGKPTSWIRAEISSGSYHGHPINEDRLSKYIKF
jgi:hypothetical protein